MQTGFVRDHALKIASLPDFSLSSVSQRLDSKYLVKSYSVNPIFTEASIPVLGPPLMPPSGSLLKNVMKEQTLRALYVPPSIAEQLLQEPNGIDLFRGLDFLCYTGGPFSPSAGKRLAEVTELCPLYGSTEAFQVPQLVPSKEDWAFMEWNPNYKLEMRLSEDEKETYELVLFADASTERSSALNHNLPGTKEFRTKDLFKPHPTKPNLWRYYGRRDDIIVLSNSEKFNPVPMELLIQGNPLLAGAVIVGQGRLRAALLVEPKSDAHVHDLASLIEMIWPVVEEANLLAPGQGRILQSMIILASTDKPFTRAGKGMVVRKLTEQSYKSELDDLYSVDSGRTQRTVPILKPTFSRQSVESFVRSVITSCFPAAIGMSSDDDMFAHGLDSLKTAELVDLFKVSLREHSTSTDLSWISMKIIYQYPTIQYLSEAFYDFVNENKVPGRETSTARTERMDALVKVYTKDLCPRRLAANASMDSNGITVALTGSTGFVGQYLLRELLGDVNIFQVFCLNRGIDARQRQKKALSHRGFEDLSKLTYLTVDLGLTRLALSSKEYSVLLNTVDVIIHNAWGVDFNQSIQSFEIPHLRGIRNLIDWSNESKKAPRIVFISSVSSVGNWKTIHPGSTSVPELPVDKYSVALHIGYGESKNVAEHVLNIANQKSQVPVTILRMGQLTGSTRANDEAWPEQEWLSSLIKASKSIAMMPDNVAPLDWLPVDKLAQIVCDIVLSKPTRTSTLVHNLVHPSPSPWSLLLETLYDSFGIVAKTVPLAAWVRELRLAEKHAATNLPSKPALKLLDLFDSLGDGIGGLRYDTEFSITTSKTMAGLKPMTKDLLRDLLKQWQL